MKCNPVPSRTAVAFAGITILTLLAGSPAFAGPSFAVRAQCEIKSAQMRILYGEKRIEEITPHLCAEILAGLEEHPELSLWRYSLDAPDSVASLTFAVVDRGSDATAIRLDFIPQEGFSVRLSEIWIHIGDAHPASSDLAEAQLVKAFGTRLKGAWKTRLEEGLKQIPVAEAQSLDPPGLAPLHVVSSLPWNKYRHLRSSQFRVICPRQGDQLVALTSKGRPSPARFTPGVRAAYDALAVVVMGRVEDDPNHTVTPVSKALKELAGLRPRILLFDRFDPPGFEVYLQ